MKRNTNTSKSAANLSVSGGPVKLGKVTLGSTRRPAEPKRQGTSAGRIESALGSGKEKTTPRTSKKNQNSKAVTRWVDQGAQQLPESKSKAVAAKKVVKKAGPAPRPEAASFLEPAAPDRSRQRSAETQAKATNIKKTGIEGRQLGFVSRMGRQKQARRDSKN